MSEGGLVKTGIEGLDSILLGGIPRTNGILLQGVTGSGKTLLGMEFIYRGISQYNEPGLIVVFETSPDKLIRDAAGFGWDLDALQRQKKLEIIFTSPQVFDQELRSPDSLLLETAGKMGARRIFRGRHWVVKRRPGGQRRRTRQVPRIVAAVDRIVEPGESDCHVFARGGQRTRLDCCCGNDRFSRGYSDPIGARTAWPPRAAQLGSLEEPGPGL